LFRYPGDPVGCSHYVRGSHAHTRITRSPSRPLHREPGIGPDGERAVRRRRTPRGLDGWRELQLRRRPVGRARRSPRWKKQRAIQLSSKHRCRLRRAKRPPSDFTEASDFGPMEEPSALNAGTSYVDEDYMVLPIPGPSKKRDFKLAAFLRTRRAESAKYRRTYCNKRKCIRRGSLASRPLLTE
jgi:hypothetical protein